MINVRKFIHPSLKNSHNVFSDILTPLNKRVGFINGSSPIVPIYFYRYIGVKENEKEYYDKLNNLDKKLSNLNGLYFKFISNIPFEVNSILSDKLQSIWNENQLEPFDNVKIEALITSLKKSGSLIDANSSLLTSSIEESLSYVLNLYLQKEPYVNLTKIKNFTLKLITWINNFAMDLVNNFNLDSKSTHDIINPKVLYLWQHKKTRGLLFNIFI
ncbi:YceG family protein [Clostridium sp.]|uniref:YceG family protein n=1 Tax=Clostridium sp. TaxID=1506 RepID=UPI0039F51CC9